MKLSYDDVKKLEEALASLPYPLKIKRIRINELQVIDQHGNKLKLTSYAHVGVLLEFILKNCNKNK
jgi:hypothetical protein